MKGSGEFHALHSPRLRQRATSKDCFLSGGWSKSAEFSKPDTSGAWLSTRCSCECCCSFQHLPDCSSTYKSRVPGSELSRSPRVPLLIVPDVQGEQKDSSESVFHNSNARQYQPGTRIHPVRWRRRRSRSRGHQIPKIDPQEGVKSVSP